jgi:predicted Na+-dependent transporter
MDTFIEVTSSVLLFCLVFGMSATVDITALTTQLKNRNAIFTGLALQYVVMPMLGFLCGQAFNLGHSTSVTLMIVTASPGGSYSNWWCSVFNADLALSVAMTAISTLIAPVMMPLNIWIYSSISPNNYNNNAGDVVQSMDWSALLVALLIIILAIGSGLWASAVVQTAEFHLLMNRIGNAAGICLIVFSFIMSNLDTDDKLWNHDWTFYAGIAMPCLLGLLIANVITTHLGLVHPERVTVSVEVCYQNVGIATAVAISMFDGEQQAHAAAVPFVYGMVEAVILFCYCTTVWKLGWTKAPQDVSFWTMIVTSYEILSHETEHELHGDPTSPEHLRPSVVMSTFQQSQQQQQQPQGGDDVDDFHYVDYSEAVPTSPTDEHRGTAALGASQQIVKASSSMSNKAGVPGES